MTTDTTTPVRANAYGCITLPFLLIALVPLGWGARSAWNDGQLSRGGQSVQGRVIDLRYETSNPSVSRNVRGGKASGKSPVVAFTTLAGEARTATGSVNRYPVPWTVGETVEVVYDPANPARADLRTEVEGWMLWFCIWCAVALVPLAIALAPVALHLRDSRRATT